MKKTKGNKVVKALTVAIVGREATKETKRMVYKLLMFTLTLLAALIVSVSCNIAQAMVQNSVGTEVETQVDVQAEEKCDGLAIECPHKNPIGNGQYEYEYAERFCCPVHEHDCPELFPLH